MTPDVAKRSWVGYASAATCLVAVVWVLQDYPLSRLVAGVALATYAAALWRRTDLFLFVLPVAIPAVDLGLWTGWMMGGEADLALLVSVGILVLRDPPAREDVFPDGWGWLALAAITGAWVVAGATGMASTYGAPYSDNAFLRPDNALRLGKGLVEALALLPFLRHRQRIYGDAITKLGWGIAAGLVAVTLIVVAERILFTGFLDFSTEYRVAGPFSSMRVGGGHIGAYAALAMPFSLTLFRCRRRWQRECLALAVCICGGYTVAVTFARTAYAACAVAMLVSGLGWLWIANRHRLRAVVAGTVPVMLVLIGLAAAAALTGMETRIAASATDFLTRQGNWRAGLAVRDRGILPTMFGMGLGTYQRVMEMRSPVNRPTNLVLERDESGVYASMRVSSPFFLGQKVSMPSSGSLHLSLRARSPDGSRVGVSLCDKVLLYSDNCIGTEASLPKTGEWFPVGAVFSAGKLGGAALGGLLHRPVELSIYGEQGHTIAVGDITLTDDHGRALLANGDFAHGLDRWIFTDDSHVSWRMLNEYLMLYFETGIFGLLAYCALAVVALFGAGRAIRSGAVEGAAVAGAVMAFLISGMFDNVLEAPRLATLFFLVCCCGLIQFEAGSVRE